MNWENVKLRKVIVDLASGGRPKGGAIDNGVFSIGAEHLNGIGGFNITNPKYIPIEYFKSIGNGKIKTDDILLVKDGATTGKVSYVDEKFPFEEAAINEHVFRVELNNKMIFPKFCYYYFISNQGQREIMSDFRGATVGGISKEILDKIQIPLPPLPTQKRIAEILDLADALRRKDQELLRKYDELAQAIFIDMFGDPVKNEKGWDEKKLSDLFISGPRLGTITPVSVDGVLPVVRVGELGNLNIAISECKKVKLNDVEKKKYLLQINDILLARAIGSLDHLGKASLIQETNEEIVFDSHVMRLQFDQNKINSFFFYTWLQSKGGREIFLQNAGKTAVQFNINGNQISQIRINLPNISLQEKFTEIGFFVQNQKMKLNIQQKNSYLLFQSLLQQAFKGELVK